MQTSIYIASRRDRIARSVSFLKRQSLVLKLKIVAVFTVFLFCPILVPVHSRATDIENVTVNWSASTSLTFPHTFVLSTGFGSVTVNLGNNSGCNNGQTPITIPAAATP